MKESFGRRRRDARHAGLPHDRSSGLPFRRGGHGGGNSRNDTVQRHASACRIQQAQLQAQGKESTYVFQ